MKHVKVAIAAFVLCAVTLLTDGVLLPGENGWTGYAMTREEGATAGPQPVTLVAFGDMMLDRYVWVLMGKNGHDYPFEHFPELLQAMLPGQTPDLLFANLEGPISDAPYVNPGTAMIFNFKPAVTETIQKYGFNLLSVANNHAYDMGIDRAQQTRDHLTAAGIDHFGDARTLGTNTSWTTTIDQTTFTFLGFNDTVQDHLDYEAATTLIRDAESTSDFTVVSIHWGIEYRSQPVQEQVDHAHAFVEAGADLILGHHSHVIGTSEWVEGPDGPRPVYYSLGNFIFDQYFQKEVQEGLGLTVTFTKSIDSDVPDQIEVTETVFDLLKSQPQVRNQEAID